MEAASQGDEKGSTFIVRLPIRAVRIGEEDEEGESASESYRVGRRAYSLRGWPYGTTESIFS